MNPTVDDSRPDLHIQAGKRPGSGGDRHIVSCARANDGLFIALRTVPETRRAHLERERVPGVGIVVLREGNAPVEAVLDDPRWMGDIDPKIECRLNMPAGDLVHGFLAYELNRVRGSDAEAHVRSEVQRKHGSDAERARIENVAAPAFVGF